MHARTWSLYHFHLTRRFPPLSLSVCVCVCMPSVRSLILCGSALRAIVAISLRARFRRSVAPCGQHCLDFRSVTAPPDTTSLCVAK